MASQKKLPARTKIILMIFGFLAGMYVLIMGFFYFKSLYEFRPYHKLAVELNDALGGGFSLTETKVCSLDGPVCPSAKLTKANVNADVKITNYEIIEKLKSALIIVVENQSCTTFKSGDQCNTTFKKDKLSIALYVDSKETYLSVTKP